MRAQLRIGEVAQLLGVTPKAIRHYQRIGLIGAPDRSPAGYRLYTAADLVILLRVRRLQALGLSLAQIKRVLGEPGDERTLRQALEQLLAATTAQRQELEAREQRVRSLLAEASLDTIEQPERQPELLRWAQERFSERLPNVSPDVWETDAKIFGMVEALRWPDGHDLPLRALLERVLQRSDDTLYQRLVTLAEQLSALASLPEDATEVEQLAEAFQRTGLAQYLQSEISPAALGLDSVFGEVVAEVTLSALSPAQRRVMRLIHHSATAGPSAPHQKQEE